MRRLVLLVGVGLVACGHAKNSPAGQPPAPAQAGAGPATVDSLWRVAMLQYHQGDWSKSATNLERLLLEFGQADSRIVRTHFYLAECYFASGDNLRAAREFRRVSDETPNDSLAPVALLRAGDVYADLWRGPELDPSYGQTALATYQELINRYPESDVLPRARERVATLDDKFAEKAFKAAIFYLRLKAYDSAILYLRDMLASYPKAQVAPEALVKLVEAYQAIGYTEEIKETCGYFRQNHPNAPDIDRVCPLSPATS